MNQSSICVVIPTYNNDKTLAKVLDAVLMYNLPVIVVNDGATDNTMEVLKKYEHKITVISYEKNRGKGYALSKGFDSAVKKGYKNALTIDSDGQHYASDIPLFVKTAHEHEGSVLVGNRNLTQENMPKKNTFANKFSNFWFTLQTSIRLPDTQSGYRLYPLQKMKHLRPFTSRYETELEILVRCAWRKIEILPVPIQVYYAPKGERISHFRPGVDFVRISVLNTVFTILAIIYGYPSMFIRYFLRKLHG